VASPRCGHICTDGNPCTRQEGHQNGHRSREMLRAQVATPAGRARHNRAHAKYRVTPAGKATQARKDAKYRVTPAGKAAQARSNAKYRATSIKRQTEHLRKNMTAEESEAFLAEMEAAVQSVGTLPTTTEEYIQVIERIINAPSY
jgi:hypothetical protein